MIRSILIIIIFILFVFIIKKLMNNDLNNVKKIKGILKKVPKKNIEQETKTDKQNIIDTYTNYDGTERSSVLPFIKAACYNGSKPGYYFGTGDYGTGYYYDTVKHESTVQED